MSGLANAASARKYRRTPVSSYRDRIGSSTWPLVCAMHLPSTQLSALAVSELVEHEERMIARALKVSVVRRSLLLSMYRTLRTVHVQDHPPMRCLPHCPVHTQRSVDPNLPRCRLREYPGLEPAHGASRSPPVCQGRDLQRSPSSPDRRPSVQRRWYPRSQPNGCTPTA